MHLPNSIQPVIVLAATQSVLTNIRNRAHSREVEKVAYIEEMLATGNDEANREVFAKHDASEDNTVGNALRAEKKRR